MRGFFKLEVKTMARFKILPDESRQPARWTPRCPAECAAAINSVQSLLSTPAIETFPRHDGYYTPSSASNSDVAQRVCTSTILQEPYRQPPRLEPFQILASIEERCGTEPGHGRSSKLHGGYNGPLKSCVNTRLRRTVSIADTSCHGWSSLCWRSPLHAGIRSSH